MSNTNKRKMCLMEADDCEEKLAAAEICLQESVTADDLKYWRESIQFWKRAIGYWLNKASQEPLSK